MKKCARCGKISQVGSAIAAHSKKHSKRRFQINLQKFHGKLFCVSCLKKVKKSPLAIS